MIPSSSAPSSAASSMVRRSPPACSIRTAMRAGAAPRGRPRATRRRPRPPRSTARDHPIPPVRCPLKRNKSRCETSIRPRYRCPMVNVGLVTGAPTPTARQAPRTNVALPPPSSPEIVTMPPDRAARRPVPQPPRSPPPRPASVSRTSEQAELNGLRLSLGDRRRLDLGRRVLRLVEQLGIPAKSSSSTFNIDGV